MRLFPKNPLARSLVLGAMMGAITSAGIIGSLIYQFQSQPSQLVCPGLCGVGNRESMTLESSSLNSPTNITLSLINTGSVEITLIAYYVKDFNGHTYSQPSWSGPSLPPSAFRAFNILIDGNAFSFQPGSIYSVELVTSRNNQFTMEATT